MKAWKVKEQEREESNTDFEASYRVKDMSLERSMVRALRGKSQEEVNVEMCVLDHRTESRCSKVAVRGRIKTVQSSQGLERPLT